MRKLILLLFFFPNFVFSQNSWSIDNENGNAFIENKGQFDNRNWQKNEVKYALQDGNYYIFFTEKGLTYRFDKMIREGGEEEEREKHEPGWENISELIHVTWQGANKNPKIIPENVTPDYYSYAIKNYKTSKVYNINHISGYTKLTYKNLYNNIDLVYEISPKGGIEYSLLLHPGANINQVKMKYSSGHTNRGEEFIRYYLDELGNIQIKTSLGHITERDLKSFYSESKNTIATHYNFDNNILSFALENYDNTKEVVIDPWVVNETANGGNSSSAVWEVETDDVGNIYTISNEDHMQLKKYNSAGTIQWTYNTPWDTGSVWIGTLATDGTGTSYVTSGVSPEIERVNASGSMVWNASGPNGSCEYWSITFNCDKTKLIVGGTWVPAIISFDFYSAIYDIDVTNGSVLGYQTFNMVNIGGISFPPVTPIEVRGICAAKNAKYFYVTHDDVGLINQNFGQCPTSQPVFSTDNGHHYAYKCENYLPTTQNGGGLKAITANDNYFYVHTGDHVEQRSYTNGAVINSVAIPSGQATTSLGEVVVKDCGLDVDDNGNVYVGSDGLVVKYDQNLNQLSQATVGMTVYDVSVNNNGEVVAVGAVSNNSNSSDRQGKVQSVNLSAGPQYIASCCDANICTPQPFCSTDPASNLTASTSGGTWSGTGITNTTNGTFDPSVAGIGTHWIYYTLSCGMDSVQVDVIDCTPISVCDDGTNLVASGGSGTISWNEGSSQTTPIITEQDCIDCPNATPQYTFGFYTGCDLSDCTQNVWNQYATGNTASPPSTWPLMVTNGIDTVIFNSQAEISPCSACTPPTLAVTGTDVTCAGGSDGSADLTVTPGSGSSYTFSWTGPGGFTSTSEDISGLLAGTYNVTVTDASNSTCTAIISVTINDGAPTEDASFTFNNFCVGSANSATGIATSGGTFSFNPVPSNGETINSSTGEIIGGIGGTTYTVQYVTSGACPGTSTQNVTVYSNPVPTIGGSTTFCVGNSTTLDVGSGYTAVLWNTGATTDTINVITAGNYTVTVTDANGCTGNSQVSVTQSTSLSPTIIGNLTFCPGSSTTLDGGAGFATYTWSTGATTQTINVTTAGTYSVTVTDAGGCSGTDQVDVTISTPPSPTITGALSFCTGNSTTLDAGSGYASYLWSSGATTQTLNVTSAGTYSVTVTDASGCSGSDQVDVTTAANLTPTITGVLSFCTGGSSVLDAGNGYTTYTWSTGATSQTITVTAAGTYSVTVTDAGGCSGSDQVDVVLSANLSPSITGNLTFCSGSSTILGAGSGYSTYTWNTGSTDSTITVTTAGTYSVTVTNGGGCSGSDQVDVTVLPNLTPTITGVLSICSGVSTVLDAGAGYTTYLWNTGDTTQTISTSVIGTYSVTVTDASTCSGSDQVDVVQSPGLSPIISGSTSFCYGSNTALSVGGGYTSYLWNNGATTNSIVVSSGGTYSVTVTDASGCSGSSQVDVQSTTPVYFDIFTDDADVCPGESVEINGVVTGGMPPYTIFSETGTVINFPYTVYPTDTITYTLSAQDACGSTTYDGLDVIVYPEPIVSFTSDIIKGCQPLTVTFNEGHNYTSYIWDFGDNSFDNLSFDHNPSHTYQKPGVFDVSVTATNEYGCSATTSFPDMITVYPKPDAHFVADPSVASIIHPLVNFYNYSTGNVFNYWSFGDGDSSLVVEPYHLYGDTGYYNITLIVESQDGCKDTTQSQIIIKPEITFYAPTAFSPDGDNTNDVFFVTGVGIDTTNFYLYVFDRWGEVIFESTDITKVWNGTGASGKIVENGTYVWLCYYYDIFGIAHEETGEVMVIR